MKKQCLICGKMFLKNPKYSKKQWEISKYCSTTCMAVTRKGIPRSEKTKKKLSEAHKGTKKPWAGKYKHTKDHNLNIKRGIKLAYEINGDEIRKKISKIHKGKKKSPESIKKMINGWKNSSKYRGGGKTIKKRKAFYQRKRELIKKGSGGSHTLKQWEELKKKYNYRCLCCNMKEPEIRLTEDHIIPIAKGGENNITNIQPLCRSCNSKKNTKIIDYAEKRNKKNTETK